jgi:hypothetical protein
MPDQPNRDDKGPSSGPHISLDIEGVEKVYKGGERMFVRVVVTAEQSTTVSRLTMAPALQFETPGDRPHREAAHTEPRCKPVERTDIEFEAREERIFELDVVLPEGPYRVEAEHFSVEWVLAARAEIDVFGQSPVDESEPFRLESGSEDSYEPAEHLERSDDSSHPSIGALPLRTVLASLILVAGLGSVVFPLLLEWATWPDSIFGRLLFSPGWPALMAVALDVLAVGSGAFCLWVAWRILFQQRFGVWTIRDRPYEVASIQVEDPVVRVGETVDASAWLAASDEVTLGGCTLTVICRERYRARNAAEREPHTVSEIVHEDTLLHPDTTSRTISSGEDVTYDFEPQIPADARNSVASRDAEDGWAVEWELRATFDWPGALNSEVTRPIIVRTAPTLTGAE